MKTIYEDYLPEFQSPGGLGTPAIWLYLSEHDIAFMFQSPGGVRHDGNVNDGMDNSENMDVSIPRRDRTTCIDYNCSMVA